MILRCHNINPFHLSLLKHVNVHGQWSTHTRNTAANFSSSLNRNQSSDATPEPQATEAVLALGSNMVGLIRSLLP